MNDDIKQHYWLERQLLNASIKTEQSLYQTIKIIINKIPTKRKIINCLLVISNEIF